MTQRSACLYVVVEFTSPPKISKETKSVVCGIVSPRGNHVRPYVCVCVCNRSTDIKSIVARKKVKVKRTLLKLGIVINMWFSSLPFQVRMGRTCRGWCAVWRGCGCACVFPVASQRVPAAAFRWVLAFCVRVSERFVTAATQGLTTRLFFCHSLM